MELRWYHVALGAGAYVLWQRQQAEAGGAAMGASAPGGGGGGEVGGGGLGGGVGGLGGRGWRSRSGPRDVVAGKREVGAALAAESSPTNAPAGGAKPSPTAAPIAIPSPYEGVSTPVFVPGFVAARGPSGASIGLKQLSRSTREGLSLLKASGQGSGSSTPPAPPIGRTVTALKGGLSFKGSDRAAATSGGLVRYDPALDPKRRASAPPPRTGMSTTAPIKRSTSLFGRR
jgi:hypothetical protein